MLRSLADNQLLLMKVCRFHPLLGLFMLVWFDSLFAVAKAAAAPVVVQPLGDSITWGYTTASAADSPGGYREPLYANLKLAGFSINFVGANTGNPGPLLTQDNQTHHDGYPKYTITEDNNNLDANIQPAGKPSNNGGFWLTGTSTRAAIYPDAILLLIGSNDNDGTTPAPVIEQRLEAMLSKIFSLRPDTHLFLSTIPPLPLPTDAGKTAIAKAYNGLMKSLTVPRFLVLGHNIRLVDQYSNFILASSPDGDTVNTALFGDNIHPNEAGYQLMGDTWSAAMLSDPTNPPPAPGAASATPVSATEIKVTWTDNSTNEGAFLIERSSDSTNFSLAGYTGGDSTNWMDTGLAPATTYFYRIRARNAAGDSAYAGPVTATTLSASTIAAPAGLLASAGYAKVSLTWSAVTDANRYNVKRATTNTGPFTTVASPGGTNFNDPGLVNGTTYFYVVSAVGSSGEGPDSAAASATPSAMPVAHYRFEFNTLDSSGHTNDGVPAGALLYGEPKVGANSAQFDGTSSFITIPRVIATNFTVAVWIRTTNTGMGSAWYNGMGILDGETVGSAADWGCSVLNSRFSVGIGNPDTTFSTSTNINDGQWHHLAATRNSDTGVVKLYIDGALNLTGTAATGPRTAPSQLRIGATQYALGPVVLRGNLDDLRLYDEVLPAGDIMALANPPSPVITGLRLLSASGPLPNSGSVALTGSGGPGNGQFRLLATTNVALPVWSPVATNDFDGNGFFTVTNAFDLAQPAAWFRVQLY
jgi:Concanavalin A-like lectin/glucanases superfamily/GDSL-like Lipase/Acylhydrolase family